MTVSDTAALPLLALLLVGACVTGTVDPDASDPIEVPDLADQMATGAIALASASLDSAARDTAGQTGSLDATNDTFQLGTLTGAITEDRSSVVLTEGGSVTLDIQAGAFAAFYQATPTADNRTVGVVGAATPVGDVPDTGRVIYSGSANVTIQDDTSLYDLTGDATIDARFAAGTVATTLDNLSGTQATGLTPPVDITDAALIGFAGSLIAGATFSGGTPSLASTGISALSGSEQSSLDGAFFGPSASEVGAAFVIDDSTDGSVIIFATILTQ